MSSCLSVEGGFLSLWVAERAVLSAARCALWYVGRREIRAVTEPC